MRDDQRLLALLHAGAHHTLGNAGFECGFETGDALPWSAFLP